MYVHVHVHVHVHMHVRVGMSCMCIKRLHIYIQQDLGLADDLVREVP